MSLFKPLEYQTRALVVSSTSSNIDFAGASSQANAMLLQNIGNQVCQVAVGSSPQYATGICLPVQAGDKLTLYRNANTDMNIGAICASGVTTSLVATLGFMV